MATKPTKPDQAVIDTAFQDPAELAAIAAAVRAASAPKAEDKTEELRPLRGANPPFGDQA
jgi:hypothetical protein